MKAARSIIRRPSRPPDRGVVVVAALLLLVVVGAFFAAAMNMGILMDSRASVQNAADSAALAAARSLNGRADGLDAARIAAQTFNDQHRVYGGDVGMDAWSDSDLEFGHWHTDPAACTRDFEGRRDCFEAIATTLPRQITSVRIRNGRDQGHIAPLPLPFSSWGTGEASVDSLAVATGAGPGSVVCALPLAVAECKVVDGANQMLCQNGQAQRLDFSNALDDGIGFINMYYPEETQAPGPSFVADAIRNRRCNATDRFEIGEAKLQDGNSMTDQAIDAIRGVQVHGRNETVVGDCLIGSIQNLAVIDEGCPGNASLHGVQEVVGFVKARIVAVTDSRGISRGCPGEPAPDVDPPAPQRSVTVEIICDAPADEDDLAGGRAFNIAGVRLRLVR
jgi:hypothetical protein